MTRRFLRPGRFDRQVVVGTPDLKDERRFCRFTPAESPLDTDVDLSVLAKTTAGFSGADLENLTNEAALFVRAQSENKNRYAGI